MKIEEKPEIQYPTEWSYTLIGFDLSELRNAASQIFGEREFSFRPSRSSSSKKYFSARVDCVVENEEDRHSIYEGLKAHARIKMVL